MDSRTAVPPRLLRLPEVIRTTALSRSCLYDLIAQGRFPRPIPLTEHARAWDVREIEAWIAERIAVRDAPANAMTGGTRHDAA